MFFLYPLIFLITYLTYGGFFDFSVAVAGLMICLAFVYILLRRGLSHKVVFGSDDRFFFYIPMFLVILSAALTFFAVDASDNLTGTIRILVSFLWYILLSADTGDSSGHISKMIGSLSYLGAVTVAIGVAVLPFNGAASFFYQAGRFGGFFQYPNTCALFFSVCVIVSLSKAVASKDSPKSAVIAAVTALINLIGLMMTGSRSVLIILIAFLIYKTIQNIHDKRSLTYIASLVTISIMAMAGMLLGLTQNIGRISTALSQNSTFRERILYYTDAAAYLLRHPLGLGYMGYHYTQSSFQTRPYTAMFVHNDLLQSGLDLGVLGMILVIIFFIRQYIHGKQSRQNKEIMTVILLASMTDFHLQYLSIVMLLCLFLDPGTNTSRSRRSNRLENIIFSSAGVLFFLYLTVAFTSFRLGNTRFTLDLMPGYSKAVRREMLNTPDRQTAKTNALRLLSGNEYDNEAVNTLVYVYASTGDLDNMCLYMEKNISIRPMDEELLDRYSALCKELGADEEITVLRNISCWKDDNNDIK